MSPCYRVHLGLLIRVWDGTSVQAERPPEGNDPKGKGKARVSDMDDDEYVLVMSELIVNPRFSDAFDAVPKPRIPSQSLPQTMAVYSLYKS